MVTISSIYLSYSVHVYLHLGDFYGKCSWISHTWSAWDSSYVSQLRDSKLWQHQQHQITVDLRISSHTPSTPPVESRVLREDIHVVGTFDCAPDWYIFRGLEKTRAPAVFKAYPMTDPCISMYGRLMPTWMGYIDGKCYNMYHTWILWVCIESCYIMFTIRVVISRGVCPSFRRTHMFVEPGGQFQKHWTFLFIFFNRNSVFIGTSAKVLHRSLLLQILLYEYI